MKFLKNPAVFLLHIIAIGLIIATAVAGVA